MKGFFFFIETELTLSLHNRAGGWSQSFAENEQGSEHHLVQLLSVQPIEYPKQPGEQRHPGLPVVRGGGSAYRLNKLSEKSKSALVEGHD